MRVMKTKSLPVNVKSAKVANFTLYSTPEKQKTRYLFNSIVSFALAGLTDGAVQK